MTAKALGFDRPTANSLDAVSDRDFVLETLAAAAIAAVHLSRFAEEIVIWTIAASSASSSCPTSSPPAPRSCRRSAIPDAAELVRAKTGRIVGALNALLMVMKGLPLAYQKDMQEDKEGAIDALAALALSHRRHDRHGARHASRTPTRMQAGGGRGLFDRDRPRRLAGARR